LTGITEDGSNGGEEEVEIDLGQVNEIENDVQAATLDWYTSSKCCWVRLAKEESLKTTVINMIPPRGPTASDSLMNLAMSVLAQSINRESLRVTALVIDVPEVQLVDWGQSLATTTRSEVDVTGSVVEHPDGDSDTELTASTDQQVDLARIE
jgi:hypothetical protein